MPDAVPSPPSRDWQISQTLVSMATLGIFFAALAVAWWTDDPSLQILLGAASSMATTVVNYWLGSSNSSQKKDAMLRGGN